MACATYADTSGTLHCFVQVLRLVCTQIQYIKKAAKVDSVSVNKFREHLKSFVEQIVDRHLPLKVTRRGGDDFVVVVAEDWEREEETLYVLQNSSLMRQIASPLRTHVKGSGYSPTPEELNEITGV